MSHVKPDTCAFEYTDAFRLASTKSFADAQRLRTNLEARIVRLGTYPFTVPAYLYAALRGYDDALEFHKDRTLAMLRGEADPYTKEEGKA